MAKVQAEKLTMSELRQGVKEAMEQLNTEAGVNKKVTNKDADHAVKAVAQVLFNALASGKHAGLHGLGTMELRERSSRMGRNPQTGDPMEIKARKGVALSPSEKLKKAVN